MKNLIVACVILVSSVASANSVNCSSANQGLSYSYTRSNGGAFFERAILKFGGITQERFNQDGEFVEFNLIAEKEIPNSATKVNGTETTYSQAWASGHVQSADGSAAFGEWVICRKIVVPNCAGPHGEPCP